MKNIKSLAAGALMLSAGVNANNIPESPSIDSFNNVAPSFVQEKEVEKKAELTKLEKQVIMATRKAMFPRDNEGSIEARLSSYSYDLKQNHDNPVEHALSAPSIEIDYPKNFSSKEDKEIFLNETLKTLNSSSEKRVQIMDNIVEGELLRNDLVYGNYSDGYNRRSKKEDLEKTSVNMISAIYGNEFKIGDEDQLIKMSENDLAVTQAQVKKIMSDPEIAKAVIAAQELSHERKNYEKPTASFNNILNIAEGNPQSFDDVQTSLNERPKPVFERDKKEPTQKVEMDYSHSIEELNANKAVKNIEPKNIEPEKRKAIKQKI